VAVAAVSAIDSAAFDEKGSARVTAVGRSSLGSPVSLAMRWSFYGLFLASSMMTVLGVSPVRLVIPFGSSELRESDLLLLAFVGTWVINLAVQERLTFRRSNLLIYALIVVLLLPAVTGIASGKPVSLVLRDCRTPLFFLALLPMLSVIRTCDDLAALIRFIVVVAVCGLLAGFGLWLSSSIGDESTPYRFVITSTTAVVVWLAFLCLSFVSLEKRPTRFRQLAWIYLLLALFFIFFANDVRSVYVGVIGALLFMGMVLCVRGRRLGVRRRIQPLALGVILVGAVLGALFLSVDQWGPNIKAAVLADMRLRRMYSLIDPSLGGIEPVGTGGTNRDDRLLGFRYGFELGRRNSGFGLGYGDNDFVDLDPELTAVLIQRSGIEGNPGNTVENLLFAHNSYGWAFGRLGLWFASAYFALIALVCGRAWKAMLRSPSVFLRVTLLGTLACVVYMLLAGFGGGAFFDYTGQELVTWLVCLAVLMRATLLARVPARLRPSSESIS
jgi:hypothetical protein